MSALRGLLTREVRLRMPARMNRIQVKAGAREPQAHSGVQWIFLGSPKFVEQPERPSEADRSYSPPKRRGLTYSAVKPNFQSVMLVLCVSNSPRPSISRLKRRTPTVARIRQLRLLAEYLPVSQLTMVSIWSSPIAVVVSSAFSKRWSSPLACQHRQDQASGIRWPWSSHSAEPRRIWGLGSNGTESTVSDRCQRGF
jgi:hypothetical protein